MIDGLGPRSRSSPHAPIGADGTRFPEVSVAQLAYNYKGQRFTLPDDAMFWRVRRLRDGQRGQLDVVRGADGRPLVVPVAIGVDEFRAAVGDHVGRYRLDALDEQEMVVPEVEAAYVNVPMSSPGEAEEEDRPPIAVPERRNAGPSNTSAGTITAPIGSWPALPMPATMSGTEYLLAEALRGQAQTIQALTAALANQGPAAALTAALAHQSAATANGATQMIGAAVELVRAADGAGMSRRVPPAPPSPPAPVAPPVAPIPPAPPASPSPEPRNARAGEARHVGAHFAVDDQHDDDQDQDDGGDDDPDDDGGDGYDDGEAYDDGTQHDQDEEDGAGGNDADMMSKLMLLADKVQGALAPVADVARLVVGGLGGGGMRNAAAGDDDADDAGDEPQADVAPPAPALPAHLRTSHMLAIGHELPTALGSRFRRIVMAMEPDERHALTEHLCAMTLEEAVADVAAKLASTPAPRYARDPGQVTVPPPVQVEPAAAPPAAPDLGVFVVEDDGYGAAREVDPDLEAAAFDSGPGGEATEATATLDATTEVTSTIAPSLHSTPVDAVHAPATPTTVTESAAPGTPVTESTALATRPTPAAPKRPAPDPQAHMLQIARHLAMPEILKVQRLAASLSDADRADWLTKLSSMTPKQAAQAVRVELARR